MARSLPTVVAVVTIAASGLMLDACAARAQELAKVRSACKADIAAHCKDVQPGGGRIAQCLVQHKDQLAPDCKAGLESATAKAKEKRGG